MKRICLFPIDPQRDFCDKTGALSVPNADQDMERLAVFIRKHTGKITDILCSMDAHQSIHIAHPIFWVNDKGEHPPPFTVITNEQVQAEVWKPWHPDTKIKAWAKYYTATLEKNGRYQLRIWPPHCLVGTEGQCIVKPVSDALIAWELAKTDRVHYIHKGNNFLTEQYSALMADVPDPEDDTTNLNHYITTSLAEADEILVAGEALSHCVASTVTDIANNMGEENIKKITLLTDATSNASGCEELGDKFIKNLVARGMNLSTTTTW